MHEDRTSNCDLEIHEKYLIHDTLWSTKTCPSITLANLSQTNQCMQHYSRLIATQKQAAKLRWQQSYVGIFYDEL